MKTITMGTMLTDTQVMKADASLLIDWMIIDGALVAVASSAIGEDDLDMEATMVVRRAGAMVFDEVA